MGNLTSLFFGIPEQYSLGRAASLSKNWHPHLLVPIILHPLRYIIPCHQVVCDRFGCVDRFWCVKVGWLGVYKETTLGKQSVIQFCSAQWRISTLMTHWRLTREKMRTKRKTTSRPWKRTTSKGSTTKFTATLRHASHYPEGTTKADKATIRKWSKKFEVVNGVLHYKESKSELGEPCTRSMNSGII